LFWNEILVQKAQLTDTLTPSRQNYVNKWALPFWDQSLMDTGAVKITSFVYNTADIKIIIGFN